MYFVGDKTLEDRMYFGRWSGLVHVKDQSARGKKAEEEGKGLPSETTAGAVRGSMMAVIKEK